MGSGQPWHCTNRPCLTIHTTITNEIFTAERYGQSSCTSWQAIVLKTLQLSIGDGFGDKMVSTVLAATTEVATHDSQNFSQATSKPNQCQKSPMGLMRSLPKMNLCNIILNGNFWGKCIKHLLSGQKTTGIESETICKVFPCVVEQF